MAKYALLLAPSANRVYTTSAAQLSIAELRCVGTTLLNDRLSDVQMTPIASIDYLTFSSPQLGEADIRAIAALSTKLALFEVIDEGLRPIEFPDLDQFDSDLLTIQKYPGKTNEQFTSLLLNLAVLTTTTPMSLIDGSRLRVLDPLCGRGTTLNQALMRGFDAYGADIDRRDIELYAHFLQTWVKTHRLPHSASFGPIRRDKKVIADRLAMMISRDRAEHKAGLGLTVEAYRVDTCKIGDFVKPVDVIVADLPYGVAHGSHRANEVQRRPGELLRDALPAWAQLLRPGGAVALSFNTKTLRRDQLIEALDRAGLPVIDGIDRFAHRVDSSIHREIVLARAAS
ncbi:MAG: hypothetical protein ABI137_02040 [Antricoccus sp.]